IVRQGAVALNIQRLLIFLQRFAELANLDKLLAAADSHGYARGVVESQHMPLRVQRDAVGARLTESVDGELRRRADYLHVFLLWVSFRIDMHQNGHAEGVQILSDFADHAEALLGAEYGVFKLEFGRSGGLNPVDEEEVQILGRNLFRGFAE